MSLPRTAGITLIFISSVTALMFISFWISSAAYRVDRFAAILAEPGVLFTVNPWYLLALASLLLSVVWSLTRLYQVMKASVCGRTRLSESAQ